MSRTPPTLSAHLAGKGAACVGELASMSHEEFVDILSRHGAHWSDGQDIALLVVGEHGWPIAADASLPPSLVRELSRQFDERKKPRAQIISERQFIEQLGLEERREAAGRLYTAATLATLLKVSRQRIHFWTRAGLIRAVRAEHGIQYFDFRQVAAAQTLVELHKSGVSFTDLKNSLEKLKSWLPEAAQPLEQLTIIEEHGKLLVRVGEEDLAEPDGQYHFDFTGEPPPLPLASPFKKNLVTPLQWRDQGRDQQSNGLFAEAENSFRQALKQAGPDPEICYDLAYVLSRQGKREQAIERYRQAVEMNPDFLDAWNNLGVLFTETGDLESAVSAFQEVLALDPANTRAIYNLADTLEELGRSADARTHWQAYLQLDTASEYAHHARQRLGLP